MELELGAPQAHMPRAAGAFLALLLLPLCNAGEFSAYFAEGTSELALSVPNASLGGHYGDYQVSVNVFPPPSSVAVIGSEASMGALVSELLWLANNSVLSSTCNYSGLLALSGTRYVCTAEGWQDCAQGADCLPQELPAPTAAGNALEKMDAAGFGIASRESSPALSWESAGAPPPQAPQPAFPPEQLLQIVGVFLVAIIASYLVLQQRQAQLFIGPQEERLLQNGTRAGILEELSASDKIPTDLSAKLGKSKATVVEHLEALASAGFVERLSTPGRKFVFYRLTRKGKQALLRRAG